MKKLLMVIPLVILLCFTFSCQKGEEVAEEPVVDISADIEACKMQRLRLTSTVTVDKEGYIGTSNSVHPQLVDSDVYVSDIEVYNGTVYIAYAQYNDGKPRIYVKKYQLSNHTLSPRYHIANYDTTDHFSISAAIDDDGYVHLVWGQHTNKETYVRTKNPEDITSWMQEELFCDSDATYQNVRTYGDVVYNLYRDGSHGQGWKLIWKSRDDSNWTQAKVISGDVYNTKHPYITKEAQWLFEDPEHQYFALYWTYDSALNGDGERRYQRITRYSLSTQKHYHLNGDVIRYKDGSLLPHEGPLDYYGQCGDFVSDDYQAKYPRHDLRRNKLGRLLIGVQRTGSNLVVLSSYGENALQGYPPRGLRASVWDGVVWTHNLLRFPFSEDLGACYIQNVRGFNNETLWLMHRKPTNKIYTDVTTDITILRNTDNGDSWTHEDFTNDDAIGYRFPEGVYSSKFKEYVITWQQHTGNSAQGNDLYIGFKNVDHRQGGKYVLPSN
jgi:hypothetical protein